GPLAALLDDIELFLCGIDDAVADDLRGRIVAARASCPEPIPSAPAPPIDEAKKAAGDPGPLTPITHTVERLREALTKIASCESHAPGDIVDIARQALTTAREAAIEEAADALVSYVRTAKKARFSEPNFLDAYRAIRALADKERRDA